MPIDDAQFKLAMSHFASGVTVVTTEHEGKRFGITVSSLASVSLHPPLVLVCILKSAQSHDAIRDSAKFGVSILAHHQAHLSGQFASRSDDKFNGVEVRTGELGIPLIEGAICMLECRVHQQFTGGDHSIFVGEVVDTQVRDDAPLVYFRAAYREIT